MQLREVEARAHRRVSEVKLAAFGSAAFAFVQSTGGDVLGNATEPVWMLVWGVALLFLASGARSLIARSDRPTVASRATGRAQDRTVRSNVELMIQTRG
ncbi:MAG TPA: hypothetical protein VFJ02_03630 [Vicinamibacterales bacterium]|nr:hypothetical protein [Vicinamibacterales bacterium]